MKATDRNRMGANLWRAAALLMPLLLAVSVNCLRVCVAHAEAAEDTLQEVVVTAQRRAERLLDVPESVSVLSGDFLNDLHLHGTADLALQVPGLSFDVLGPGESTLAIRGLGTAYGLEPAVSFYINETPLDIRTDGFSGAPDVDFFDVDRVEVLRGPQGTLYGSSSMGGALRVLTKQPDPSHFEISTELAGSNMNAAGAGYVAKSAVNLPLSSDAAVRFVGTFEHVPGYIDRIEPSDYKLPPVDGPILATHDNGVDIKGGRVIALWKPTDTLSVTPSVIVSDIEAAGTSQYFSNLPTFTTSGYYASPQSSRLVIGNLEINDDFGFANLLSSTSVSTRNTASQTDFTLFFANLARAFGVPYPPNTPGVDFYTSSNHGFVQELRLTSPTEQRLRWVAGAYYSRYTQHSTESTNSADFADEIGQVDDPNLYTFFQAATDQQTAVFADLTFKILPELEFTAGERYYELRDKLENTQGGVLASPSQPLTHAKASGNSPRAVLAYHPDGNSTVYLTAAKGYRPGGPNVGLPTGAGCTLGAAYSPLYEPDSVWNYEIGGKGEFYDRKLAVNLAAYQINWKNVQQAVTDPGCGYVFVANVGSAQTRGLEAEVSVKPVQWLLLFANGAYSHAKFTSIDADFQGASTDQPGDALPDVPRQKYTIGSELSHSFGQRLAYSDVDWSHTGTVPTGFTYNDTRPAYSSLNASVGVRQGNFDLSLYGHNLTNSVGVLRIQQGTTDGYKNLFNTQTVTPPRVVGIDFKFHY